MTTPTRPDSGPDHAETPLLRVVQGYPVADLVEWPGNARRHDTDVLDESVAAHGQFRSVLARELPDGRLQLLAGHGTRAALERAGRTHIDVEVRAVADDAQARRIVLVDNRANDRAGYDELALLDLLDEADRDGGLAGTGFDRDAYEALLDEVGSENPHDWSEGAGEAADDTDATPPAVEDTVSEVGDVWVLGRHRLVCGNSSDPGVHRLLVGPVSVGAIVTDPPYGMYLDTDFSTIRGTMGTGSQGNTYEPVIGDHDDYDPRPLMDLYGYVREQFWFGADYYAERIPERNDGSWLVWDKRSDSQADGVGSEFELCWSRQRHKRRTLRHEWFGFLASADNAKDARNRQHPTQKPVTLFTDILGQWVPDAAVVLDPYGGSGSVLLACEITGRACLTIELHPPYCDVIARRWQELTGELPYNERLGEPVDLIGRQ